MDRFMMRISIGYPERAQELQMALNFLAGQTHEGLSAVCGTEELLELIKAVEQVTVKESVIGYANDLVNLTREEKSFLYGVSPRGLLALIRAAQAHAFLQKRDYVKPDDIKSVANDILLHRLTLTSEARMMKTDASAILRSLIVKTKVPIGE